MVEKISSDFSPNYPETMSLPEERLQEYIPSTRSLLFLEYYDLNSEDSIQFSPTQNYSSGDAIQVPSLSSGDTITFIAEADYYFDDTLYYDPSLTVDSTNYVINSVTGETLE